MGEHDVLRGLYLVPTPIVGMTGLNANNIQVTLVNGERTFNFTIDSASLTSFSGSYQGHTNSVDGSITVDGYTLALNHQPLEEGYNQAAFDATYACTPGLLEPVPFM